MTIQLDKKGLITLMRTENERIMDLLVTFNVPDSIDDINYDEYLLQNNKKTEKNQTQSTISNTRNPASIDELQERLNTIRNKMKTKKRPISERSQKKREAKKLKKNKEFKKVLVSAAKSIKNENQKLKNTGENEDEIDSKRGIKIPSQKAIFNGEGKIVFSKFDFASHPGAKVKKSHQNPKELLKRIKETDKKIKELKEKGEAEKAAEIKNDLAWQKAFEKTEGKKVKDDPKLLYKAIKKRKVEKKKSKQEWVDRKKKIDSEIDQRQKKRQENINKRIKDKKNRKLKKMSKKGKVIPGF